MMPVATIEALVTNPDSGTAEEPWNPDFVAHIGQNIYQGMNCMTAWKVIPIGALIAAIEEIRNRVLNFVLEIESEAPEAGEAKINSNPVPSEKVEQIFNTYITGNVQNVATGSHSFDQNVTNKETDTKLFTEMLDAIKLLNRPEITSPILENIEEMRDTHGTDGFKKHYQKFMSLLADHMQVLGPVVAPYLPTLAAIMP